MSANINSMMYVGEKPWHGLGKKLEKAATAAEAITGAGLDWIVKKFPIFASIGGQSVAVPDKFATVRTDTNQVLGTVGRVYRPLQNKEAFSFFDAVVGIKEAIYHTAGALGNGEIIWILAKLNGIIRIKSQDVVEKFLLLTNRHDGMGSVMMLFTPIRVVCQNTLNLALSSTGAIAKLRHCSSMGLKIDEVRSALGIISNQYLTFEQAAQKLATVQLTQEAYRDYLTKTGLLPEKAAFDKLDGREKTMAQKLLDEVSGLFEHGKGNDIADIKHTAWTAYNSVTEYVDYVRTSRGAEENRTKSLLLGSGATIKAKAWDAALVLAR